MTIHIPRTLQCPVNKHRLKPQPGESLLIRIQSKRAALTSILGIDFLGLVFTQF